MPVMGFHGQIVQKLAGEADSRQRHPSSRAGQQRIIKSAAIFYSTVYFFGKAKIISYRM